MKKKVGFLISEFQVGGAARVMNTIINNVDLNNIHPILIIYNKKITSFDIKFPVYVLDNNIRMPIIRYLLRIYKLRDIIRNEGISSILSFMPGPNLLNILSTKIFHSNVVCIISERTIPSNLKTNLTFLYFWRFVFRYLYKYSDYIIVNAKQSKDELLNIFKIPEKKVKYIINPFDFKEISRLSNQKNFNVPKEKVIICIARLIKSKNIDLLIESFKIINKKIRSKLIIVGYGPEKEKLIKLSKDLNLKNHIIFTGDLKNPYYLLKRADILIHTSLYEGFPNVVVESLYLNTPVIACDCPSDLKTIKKDSNSLILCDFNKEEIAEKAIKILNNKRKIVFDWKKYDACNVVKNYQDLLLI